MDTVTMDSLKCIYMITTKHDGKVYIGQTSQGGKVRWWQHKHALKYGTHYNTHLQRACTKHGLDTLEFTILAQGDNIHLDQMEKRYIQEYRANDPKYGYNKTLGGSNPEEYLKLKKLKKILAYDPDTDFILRDRDEWENTFVKRARNGHRLPCEQAIVHPDGREWYRIYDASNDLDLSFFNIFKAIHSPDGCNGLRLRIR
jgi:hypothetical protein